MIQPNTLDEAIVEAHRFIKAAKALRAHGVNPNLSTCSKCLVVSRSAALACDGCGSLDRRQEFLNPSPQHAATLRASMDLTRKLADLRQSR